MDVAPPGFGGLKPSPLLPYRIYQALYEVHAAVYNNLNMVAGIRIRAMVETVCRDKGLFIGTVEKRIDELAVTGLISADDAKILHGLRFMGNKAPHEVEAHSTEELETAMDVIEHLIMEVYLPQTRATKLGHPSSPIRTE